MTLPASGQISLNDVNVELGNSGTAEIGMNSTAVRDLFEIASGEIEMSDGYGKSDTPPIATSIDYIMVAGGGGGGLCAQNSGAGAGGGAGLLLLVVVLGARLPLPNKGAPPSGRISIASASQNSRLFEVVRRTLNLNSTLSPTSSIKERP